jgi:ABC-type transporter Mla subunit MlaD
MDHETLLTIFIIIAAAAVVLQALAMLGIYTVIRRIQDEVAGIRSDVRQRIDPLAQSIAEIIGDSREPLRTVVSNLVEVSRVLRDRTSNVDEVLDELIDKFRLQVVRVDHAISDILEKIEKTTTTVQRNVVAPVLEVSALLKGFKIGLDFFLSRRRESQAREVTQDEQMFI